MSRDEPTRRSTRYQARRLRQTAVTDATAAHPHASSLLAGDAGDAPPPPPAPIPHRASAAVEPPAPTAVFRVPSLPDSRKRSNPDRQGGPRPKQSRSVGSASSGGSTQFTDGVKATLKHMYGTRCWHCLDGYLPHAAHVLEQQASDAFPKLRARKLLNLEGLHKIENALLLCPQCHACLDHSIPYLIVVPADLGFFVQAEERWQAELAGGRFAPATGMYTDHCQKKFPEHYEPGALPVGGLYACYMTEYFLGHMGRDVSDHPLVSMRQWHGDPLAMIYRAKCALATNPDSDVRVKEALMNVKEQMNHLDSLYDKGDWALLKLQGSTLPPPPPDRGGTSDAGPDTDFAGSQDSRFAPSPARPGNTGPSSSPSSATGPNNSGSQHSFRTATGGPSVAPRESSKPEEARVPPEEKPSLRCPGQVDGWKLPPKRKRCLEDEDNIEPVQANMSSKRHKSSKRQKLSKGQKSSKRLKMHGHAEEPVASDATPHTPTAVLPSPPLSSKNPSPITLHTGKERTTQETIEWFIKFRWPMGPPSADPHDGATPASPISSVKVPLD
ncbi:hypothetical protein BDV96DRAFT_607727 [Lophiotrema nucula]|uniref:HNH nuclease domain-containing protein n=1 Tax=Lophiotrema nucula TaxID=690887 RepID=A0A6A5YH75_9PLEO|nr:hypothetical protein BDV96DRAFT_607727 [Lophiotrema nucula]